MLLICHPATPCTAKLTITAEAVRGDAGSLYLRFIIDGEIDRIVMPPSAAPVRTDGLWQTTCCEAFVIAEGEGGYLELNLSPSTAWASYRFDSYRAGMRDAEVVPDLSRIGGIVQALVDVSSLPDLVAADWRVGLSVVIEELDGTRSYWALAHPDGPPDFHAPDCFALTLEAPAAS